MNNQKERLSLLIIDDNKEFLHVISNNFHDLNKYTATNGTSGINKFKKTLPNITLLDIDLPDINGLEVLKQILRYEPEAFIIMLTKNSVYSDIKEAIGSGAFSYILKPFKEKTLLDTINQYYNHLEKLEKLSSEEKLAFYEKKINISTTHKKQKQLEAEDIKAQNQEKYEQKKSGNMNIAILDIYKISSGNIKQYFRENGYILNVHENEAELLEAHAQTIYKVILINTGLEHIDGYNLSEEIRKLEKNKKIKKSTVIGLISSQTEIKEKKWYKYGMDDFIQKPAKLTQITDTIEKNIKKDLTVPDITNHYNNKNSIHNQSKEVAIIDPYSINLINLQKYFAKYGYNLSISSGQEEFLKKYQKNRYSAIFINSELQDTNGYKLAQLIRKYEEKGNFKETSILIGLVKSVKEIKEQFWKKAGMDDFLSYPIDLEQFINTLKHYEVKTKTED